MRALRSSLALTVLFVVTGCGGAVPSAPASGEPPTQPTMAESETTEAEMEAATAAGREEEQSDDLIEFAYSYPAKAGAIPALRALLDARLDTDRSELEARARKDRQEREKRGFPYHPHASQTAWDVVTETPRWLSLSAQHYSFSGGAHGMTSFDSLLWDRRDNARREALDLFTSPAALRDAIRTPFCKALNVERAKKRGAPVPPGSDAMFDECIDPLGETLILGSSNGATFNRIGVLIAPYSAGPYVEGTYEVTLPVTQAVMAAVRPAYREGFAVTR